MKQKYQHHTTGVCNDLSISSLSCYLFVPPFASLLSLSFSSIFLSHLPVCATFLGASTAQASPPSMVIGMQPPILASRQPSIFWWLCPPCQSSSFLILSTLLHPPPYKAKMADFVCNVPPLAQLLQFCTPILLGILCHNKRTPNSFFSSLLHPCPYSIFPLQLL